MAIASSKDVHDIPVMAVSVGKRVSEPTKKRIKAMADAIALDGQLNPILVRIAASVAGKKAYYVVCGATRLLAMRELGKETIRAIVVGGAMIDFEIAELAENLDRNDLRASERRMMKAKLEELRAKQLSQVAAEVGGRGKRGGLREAARQMGVPRSTAQDLMKKVAEKDKTRPVSDAEAGRKMANNVVKLKPKSNNEPVHALEALCRIAEDAVTQSAAMDADVCPTCGRPFEKQQTEFRK